MADATIRGALGIDPDALSDDQWTAMAFAAEALERRRASLQADYIAARIGDLFKKRR